MPKKKRNLARTGKNLTKNLPNNNSTDSVNI